MVQPAALPFLAHFAALQDPRQTAKVLYPLPELLLLLLCGTVAGADDFVELALWGGEHLLFLRRFLPFARGISSVTSIYWLNCREPPEQVAGGFSIYSFRLLHRFRPEMPGCGRRTQPPHPGVRWRCSPSCSPHPGWSAPAWPRICRGYCRRRARARQAPSPRPRW